VEDRWGAAPEGALAECVHGSRLLGSEPSLVLHGGGNTSVKAPWPDVTGAVRDAIFVKGSGWDLATIEAAGFAPLDLPRLRELVALDALSDEAMMRELSAAKLDPGAPQPSVEALLHALLPHPAVLHSHADVIVTLTNVEDASLLARALGPHLLDVRYVMPGFELAKEVARRWAEVDDEPSAIVLRNHGLFTFGATTADAYRRHIEIVSRAEAWLAEHAPPPGPDGALPACAPVALAEVRQHVCGVAGMPMIVRRHADVGGFVGRADLESLATRGPLTPDHVIRTKRVPLVGRDVAAYADAYRVYVERNAARAAGPLVPIDPAPRVILDPEIGMLTVGSTAADAAIAADIYRHTMPVLARSEDHLGGYRALPEADLFDVEYWELEQAKLRLAGPRRELSGRVALVSGAASGIGRACAAELLQRGAAVIGVDLADGVVNAFAGEAWLGCRVDVTDADAVADAIGAGVERFGGVDHVVASAGIFGPTRPIAELSLEEWRRVMAVNVDAVVAMLPLVHPLLARSPIAASVVMVGSKNVAAPGAGAAAYSASKAALTQLARVAALEWAPDGIRVSCVHPDAVFDTGLWTDAVLAERAAAYGLSVDEYKRRNLLGTEITSRDVARAVVALATDTFRATTGAQIPIDGGNDRVI
jgi:rhamnose utilization protein RhaD (predicted bifunctional aldolase and dehydrogenase)/NAD(P)-dependent dehydrogenase (short-subunit alcohol dehydrogenase family)